MKSVADRIAKLDRWFDTIRGVDGYGGPVVHWWQNSLHYTGAGLDWRYEGIVQAYLNLYKKVQSHQWLQKARQAADDLVKGQLESGNFRFSSFEQNPHVGGTPHEAACDIALLALAKQLQQTNIDATVYIEAARKNIEKYYIQTLWNVKTHYFRDNTSGTNIVPNKAATLVEALFLLAETTNDERYIHAYALPTLEAIVAHQITDGSTLNGAIYQMSRNGRYQAWFFPYYAARCVPALLIGYQHTQNEIFLNSAKAAMQFVEHFQYEDGSFAQIVYSPKQINRYPQWVAGNGDILRAFRLLEPYGYKIDLSAAESWLLQRQHPHGPFHTAYGFASQVNQRQPTTSRPDLRDILPVAGWTDKPFRYLTEQYDGNQAISPIDSADIVIKVESQLRGHRVEYVEDRQHLAIRQQGKVLYQWTKGTPWANIDSRQLIWK